MADPVTLISQYLHIAELIIIPLSIFPMILNLKYYSQTKLIDYLLLSIYFILWSFGNTIIHLYLGITVGTNELTTPLQGQSTLLDAFMDTNIIVLFFTLDALPLFIVAIRAKYGSSLRNLLIGDLGFGNMAGNPRFLAQRIAIEAFFPD